MAEHLEIVILEDNQERRTAMQARLQDRFPQFGVSFFHEPANMMEHLRDCLTRTIVISLDHDLDLIACPDGTWHDPGTGMDVVDWLVQHQPACPVMIHSTNLPAAKLMQHRLREAGWQTKRCTPYDDLAWIDAEWFTGLRNLLMQVDAVAESPSIK